MEITAYKGMDKNMQCRGFQYEVGGTYETDEARCCEKGFHACETPLDVLRYYPPSDSRYFEVEQSGEISRKPGDDSKVASSKLTVKAEIGLPGLINAQIEWVKAHIDKATEQTNTGDYSAATNTGVRSAAEVTGKASVAIATGSQSKARGAKGCAIVLVERGDYDGETYPIKAIKAVKIDGKRYKADTWYKLVDGKVVEAE